MGRFLTIVVIAASLTGCARPRVRCDVSCCPGSVSIGPGVSTPADSPPADLPPAEPPLIDLPPIFRQTRKPGTVMPPTPDPGDYNPPPAPTFDTPPAQAKPIEPPSRPNRVPEIPESVRLPLPE